MDNVFFGGGNACITGLIGDRGGPADVGYWIIMNIGRQMRRSSNGSVVVC